MIPGAGRDPQRLGQRRDGDPVHLVGIHDAVEQQLFRADGDGVGLHILGADVDRRTHGKAKALPLADGIPHRALVGAHLPALGIEEVPVRVVLAGEILHELLIVAVRHKADILTVVLAGVDEMLLFGNGAHFGLVERPQWQPHMGQLFLCQIIKHIALIFSFIKAFFQQPAASGLVLLDAGVVAGDDILHPVLLRPAEQVVELHILVAVDAGVGGAARLIDPDEFFDDLLPEIGGEIQHLIGNIHRIGHLGGVLNILFRAAGVEAQTRKLMEVCRMRKTPVIVFVNKMDRDGKDPFDLLDEIEEELHIHVRPLSWPIDMGQRFRGVYNIYEQKLNLYTPSKQYVTENVEFKDINSPELENYIEAGQAEKLRSDIELIEGVYPEFDVDTYLKGDIAPVFFGSALNNFGVKELLDCFINIAPSPRPVSAVERVVDPEEDAFSGFVFKIHANMDPNHRSCIAFVKICSGRFERNANYKHVRFGKMMRFSSPTAFMAQKKEVVDEAFAGDIIGLPDTGNFKIGDTLTEGELLHFRGLPSFSPEMFKYIENADPMKQKQLAKGIDQLMDEGVAQLFVNQFNGRKIIGTVGQLQFEVIQYRLENEYSAKCRWEPLSLYKACWIESDDAAELEAFKKRKYQYMAKDREGRDVFLADSGYVLQMAQMDFKHIKFHFTSEF